MILDQGFNTTNFGGSKLKTAGLLRGHVEIHCAARGRDFAWKMVPGEAAQKI